MKKATKKAVKKGVSRVTTQPHDENLGVLDRQPEYPQEVELEPDDSEQSEEESDLSPEERLSTLEETVREINDKLKKRLANF